MLLFYALIKKKLKEAHGLYQYSEKQINSELKNDEIKNARDKAMLLNTHDILDPSKKKVKPADTDKKLTFLLSHNDYNGKEYKESGERMSIRYRSTHWQNKNSGC